jgi:radical SAM family uncharacterized protein/radical SAM-linked protein
LFDEILDEVEGPASYLGTEPNRVLKDPSGVAAAVALAFPDLYEIGMSHLGLKILYRIVNDQSDLAAERVFCPGDDFAEALARRDLPLPSLESRRPLSAFDMVGFTIPYEMSYTTVLRMLDLARIPLRAADRSDADPLIVGGGASVYNPEPAAPFFDLFVLGDGERTVVEILRLAGATRAMPRAERLKRFAAVDGVYVPSLYEVAYKADGAVEQIRPTFDGVKNPRRVWLPTLAESPYPTAMVVPFTETTQDRVNVEIDRGCTQGCRFCQAGITYRPVRERTPDQVMAIMEEAVGKTGYEDVSVMSLSAGDYSQIGPLVTRLMDRYAEDRVSLSLPSLRSASVTTTIVEQVGRVKKSGFTITAEAGSERLRNVLNKKASDEEIERAARLVLEHGWRGIKLYFMIGLPTETDDDVDAIYDLADRIAFMNVGGKRFANVNVSVGNFVPKAHTAFQWIGQDSPDELTRKKERLFSLIRRNRRLRLRWHDVGTSRMEAVFSRGDRRLADVIENAYRAGQRLDGWSERFDRGRWEAAFAAAGLDPAFYANRTIPLDETLPWDHIDTGLTKSYFVREWEAAARNELTGDCKTDRCLACGLDPKGCFTPYDLPPTPSPVPPVEKPEREAYRVGFTKTGDARFFSHLQTKTILHRACRRAGLPLAYSEGFSPHPKLSFGPALPVGMESLDEAFDIVITDNIAPEEIVARLNPQLPVGMTLTGARRKLPHWPSIQEGGEGARYRATFRRPVDDLPQRVAAFVAAESWPVIRESKKKRREFDLKRRVGETGVDVATGALLFTLVDADGGSARPAEMLAALFPEGLPPHLLTKLQTVAKGA